MWILQKWLNFLIILSCGIAVEGSDNGFILSKRKKLSIFSVLKKPKGIIGTNQIYFLNCMLDFGEIEL